MNSRGRILQDLEDRPRPSIEQLEDPLGEDFLGDAQLVQVGLDFFWIGHVLPRSDFVDDGLRSKCWRRLHIFQSS